jgi:hypothetical protein
MPRLRIDDELDADDLDGAEYSTGSYQKYEGEQPPVDTYLRGYIKNIWWTYTASEDPMLKVLFVADGNTGDDEDYNGLPVWENMALTKGAKFKWGPFFEHFGLTIRLLKAKTIIAEEDDEKMGSPVTKIGTLLTPGEDSDNARCAIITTREKYDGKWQTHVGEWLDDEEPEEEEAAEDEEQEEEEEEEEEEEPPPPARTRRAASGKTSAQPATKSAVASKPAATKTSAGKTSATRPTATKRPAAAKPGAAKAAAAPARGKRRAATLDDEPPF